MSRSGYSEDCDNLGLYRANVDRALGCDRGQLFLREMAAALDAMPVKELVAGEVVRDSEHVCAMGAVIVARKLDVDVDLYDAEDTAKVLGIKRMVAAEVAYQNDEAAYGPETASERWTRMRRWVDDNIARGSSK